MTEAPLPVAPEGRAGRANLLQLIQLRWLAVAGQCLTIVAVDQLVGIPLPLAEMLGLIGVLAAFNLACLWRTRLATPVANLELFVGLLVDVGVLTAQLYHSGGTDNPFVYLYLLQVVVAALLLRPRYLWAVVAATVLAFLALTQWHRPLALEPHLQWALPPQYLGGLLLCFVLNVSLLVIFIGRISRNLRQRDAELADLRQRAAEEVHILRMGLLASGAAHELGTPLATLSVILGDWAHMAPFAGEPELREEIEEMQQQQLLQRCKAIVSGILMSAGEMRGEAAARTSLWAFIDELAAAWRLTRPGVPLQVEREALPDVAIISDSALQQVIANLLDNASEAAPGQPLRLLADCMGDEWLRLRVIDRGPGFAPDTLARFGHPYQSSKGQPGRGLGLFLSVNVARTLGGRLEARNPAEGGAEVTLTLPLASLLPAQSRRDA
jgi:two-component system sensor histidine kinase RegB